MTPSVGRIVHYVSRGSADGVFKPECRAAIIAAVYGPDHPHPLSEINEALEYGTEIGAEWVALVVFNPEGLYFNDACHSERKDRGTWHWPELVPDGKGVPVGQHLGEIRTSIL